MKVSRLRGWLLVACVCVFLLGVVYRLRIYPGAVREKERERGFQGNHVLKESPVTVRVTEAGRDQVPTKKSDTEKSGPIRVDKMISNETVGSQATTGALRCAEVDLNKRGVDLESVQRSLLASDQVGEDIIDKTLPSDIAVPRIIHQIWQSEFVHKSLGSHITSWVKHNPGWKHVLWTHESARHFVANVFPSYLSLYDSYGANIYRADVARYFILYTFGGVYMDLDIESLRPLDIVNRHSCFISQEPNLHRSVLHKRKTTMASNAFMGCRKGHPFFKQVIDTLPDFARKTSDLLGSTGPIMLDNSYKNYFDSNPERSPADDLFVAPGPYFQPTFDDTNTGMLKERCTKLVAPDLDQKFCDDFLSKFGPVVLLRQVADCQNLVAKNFANTPESYSYSNHYWLHSYWYPLKYHGRNNTLNVSYRELIPEVIMGETLVEDLLSKS